MSSYSDPRTGRLWNEPIPDWARAMQQELTAIRTELRKCREGRAEQSAAYFAFVEKLRVTMRADTDKGVYPEIDIDGMRLGVTFGGLLYDKITSLILPRDLAFAVYEKLFSMHRKSPIFDEDREGEY